jgi:hypothetical protein
VPTYLYPESAELTTIAQTKLPRLLEDRPIFDLLPTREVDEWLLIWEQLDNFKGLQQARGLNGEPPRVKPVGLNQWEMQPGVYGEYIPVEEQHLTTRRRPGTWDQPIDLTDIVMEKQDHLLLRRLDRVENIGWTLLTTGTFSVPGPLGNIVHTDTFPLQTFTSLVPWSTASTATPLADFSSVQLQSRGYSVSFGADAVAYMNRVTYNYLRLNTNNADVYGRRTQGLGTFNNLAGLNSLFQGDDLPKIVIYDQGYLVEGAGNTFVPFIPNGKVVVVGVRPAGQQIGEYRFVRNANNPGLEPGPYMKVIDHGDVKVPREIEVHDGHNGGPVLFYPSAIVLMTVL